MWWRPGAADPPLLYDPVPDAWTQATSPPGEIVPLSARPRGAGRRPEPGRVAAGSDVFAVAATTAAGPTELRIVRHSPATGTWQLSSPALGASPPLTDPSWTGREVLVHADDPLQPALAYDPAQDT